MFTLIVIVFSGLNVPATVSVTPNLSLEACEFTQETITTHLSVRQRDFTIQCVQQEND